MNTCQGRKNEKGTNLTFVRCVQSKQSPLSIIRAKKQLKTENQKFHSIQTKKVSFLILFVFFTAAGVSWTPMTRCCGN